MIHEVDEEFEGDGVAEDEVERDVGAWLVRGEGLGGVTLRAVEETLGVHSGIEDVLKGK